MRLYTTEQFQILFEVYNRFLTNPGDHYNPQDPGNLHFTYEGTEYILYELALHNNNPEAEEGADFYETEIGCCMSDDEEINVEDLEWGLNFYPLDAGETTRFETINLPYNHPLPREILTLARQKWPKLNEYDVRFLTEHLGATLP
jgi:hypothetical protein